MTNSLTNRFEIVCNKKPTCVRFYNSEICQLVVASSNSYFELLFSLCRHDLQADGCLSAIQYFI